MRRRPRPAAAASARRGAELVETIRERSDPEADAAAVALEAILALIPEE
jgi:hypothetical protein